MKTTQGRLAASVICRYVLAIRQLSSEFLLPKTVDQVAIIAVSVIEPNRQIYLVPLLEFVRRKFKSSKQAQRFGSAFEFIYGQFHLKQHQLPAKEYHHEMRLQFC